MKVLVPDYTFNAAEKQVTFTNYPSIKKEQILLITNTSQNQIIYNFASPALGGSLTSNTITLSADTTLMLNEDNLQIFIDDFVIPSTNQTLSAIGDEVLDIQELITTSNNKTDVVIDRVSSIQSQVLGDQRNLILNIRDRADSILSTNNTINNNFNSLRNSFFNGIGGYSIGGYLSQLSELNDQSVRKTNTTTLTNSFTLTATRRIYNIFGISTANVDQYIQIYDTVQTTPTGIPSCVFLIPANSNFNFEFNRGIQLVNNRAIIVNSITPINYNAGNNDLFFTVLIN
jgi:hypothetical protein